jgi:hypothetical protein
MLTNPLLLLKVISAGHKPFSNSTSSSVHLPIVALVAQDVTGWRVEQLFYHVNTGGYLLLPLECRKRVTSHFPMTCRAPPITTGYQTGTHDQSSDWSRVKLYRFSLAIEGEDKMESIHRTLESG